MKVQIHIGILYPTPYQLSSNKELIMSVDSPEEQAHQRGDDGSSSTLFWIFLIVAIIGGAVFVGLTPK